MAVRHSHNIVLTPQLNFCTTKTASFCCNKPLLSNCGHIHTIYMWPIKERHSSWKIYQYLVNNAQLLELFGIFSMENTHLYHKRCIFTILPIITFEYRVYKPKIIMTKSIFRHANIMPIFNCQTQYTFLLVNTIYLLWYSQGAMLISYKYNYYNSKDNFILLLISLFHFISSPKINVSEHNAFC